MTCVRGCFFLSLTLQALCALPTVAAEPLPFLMASDFSDMELVAWRIEQGHQDKANPLLEPKMPWDCLLYTSPSPRDKRQSRMPSSA